MTSRTKTIHSMNHGQKNTRSIEPIAPGTRPDVMNQMPTPVTAPTPVMMIATGLIIARANCSYRSSPVRRALYSARTTIAVMPIATPWLMITCSTASIAMIIGSPSSGNMK